MQVGEIYLPPEVVDQIAIHLPPHSLLSFAVASRSLNGTLQRRLEASLPSLQRDVLHEYDTKYWDQVIQRDLASSPHSRAGLQPRSSPKCFYPSSELIRREPLFSSLPFCSFNTSTGPIQGVPAWAWLQKFIANLLLHVPSESFTGDIPPYSAEDLTTIATTIPKIRNRILAENCGVLPYEFVSHMKTVKTFVIPRSGETVHSEGGFYYWWALHFRLHGRVINGVKDLLVAAEKQCGFVFTSSPEARFAESSSYSGFPQEVIGMMETEIEELRAQLLYHRYDLGRLDKEVDERFSWFFKKNQPLHS